jgi:hypothetical protein
MIEISKKYINNLLHNLNNSVKELKKINVSVIRALVFFYCAEIYISQDN